MTLIKGVEQGSRRSELIFYLLDLMDKEYQEKKLLTEDRDDNYHWEFQSSFELLCEDAFGYYIDNNTIPYEDIGRCLKTRGEAEIIYKVCKQFEPLYLDSNNDSEFLNSPQLPIVRELSREAFIEFMKNEKGNKDFCELVMSTLIEERNFIPDPKKTDYENIIDFASQVKV